MNPEHDQRKYSSFVSRPATSTSSSSGSTIHPSTIKSSDDSSRYTNRLGPTRAEEWLKKWSQMYTTKVQAAENQCKQVAIVSSNSKPDKHRRH